ncbi:MAG: NUDIX domain-containing protein [Nanoarchaeota archaeon]
MSRRAVVAVVNYNGKILLGKKNKNSKKFLAGEWHVPGENVEDNESDDEALIRGIKEEAGLEIVVGEYLGSHITNTGKEAKWYECFAESDKLIVGSDLEDAKFIPRNEVLIYCDRKAKDLWPEKIKDYFKQ